MSFVAAPVEASPVSPIDALDRATSDGLAHDTGFYAGATIGRGSLDVSCAGCPARPALDDALSLSAFAGYRLTDRVGVFGEYWLTSYGTSVKYTT